MRRSVAKALRSTLHVTRRPHLKDLRPDLIHLEGVDTPIDTPEVVVCLHSVLQDGLNASIQVLESNACGKRHIGEFLEEQYSVKTTRGILQGGRICRLLSSTKESETFLFFGWSTRIFFAVYVVVGLLSSLCWLAEKPYY